MLISMLSPYSRILTTLGLPALASGFRRDISAASERIRLISRNNVSRAFMLINDSLHIVTAIPPLIVLNCSRLFDRLTINPVGPIWDQ